VSPHAIGWRKIAILSAVLLGLAIGVVMLKMALPRLERERSITGAVLTANADPRKQLPIANVQIAADVNEIPVRATSDSSGFFRLTWRGRVWQGEHVVLRFRHPDYEPLEITQPLANALCIARMQPAPSALDDGSNKPEISIADIRVRYSVKATTTMNVGSTVKTFEIVNTGNIPCAGRQPCSPDGRWKAAIGSMKLDAGDGQDFANVRVSCIAGPCPFTKVESDGFARGGRAIEVSARAWSDTVTFLVEAEVVHTMVSDAIRQSYPSIFGRDMTFTLPATGQGPSIEAEVNGLEIVFPLGPDLNLSWASCSMQPASNSPKLYSCTLKPGYRFR
jgi:hypothetical protein